MKPKKKLKYKNIKTAVDGIVFDSQKEANRYIELKLLERAGEIRNLELQPRYNFVHNGMLICFYKADFKYEEKTAPTGPRFGNRWGVVIEDVKGVKTAMYRLKKKMMLIFYNIEVRET